MEAYPMASPAPPGDPFAALLQRARAIAADVLAPRAEQTDQAGGPPVDNLRALGAAGLLGLTTPARYGGQEAPQRRREATTLQRSGSRVDRVFGIHSCSLIACTSHVEFPRLDNLQDLFLAQ